MFITFVVAVIVILKHLFSFLMNVFIKQFDDDNDLLKRMKKKREEKEGG